MSTQLQTTNGQTPRIIPYFDPSDEDVQLIRRQICPTLNNDEFKYFMWVAKARGLDPRLNQIYGIKRGGKMNIQTAIEGFCLIAERTGLLRGHKTWTTGSLETGDLIAHALVLKAGWDIPKEESIKFVEFKQTFERDHREELAPMWKKMPEWMLKKVALARTLDLTFPEQLGGMYINEEMPAADHTSEPFQYAEVSEATPKTSSPKGKKSVAPVPSLPDTDTDVYNQDAPIEFNQEPIDLSQHRLVGVPEDRSYYNAPLAKIHKLNPEILPKLVTSARYRKNAPGEHVIVRSYLDSLAEVTTEGPFAPSATRPQTYPVVKDWDTDTPRKVVEQEPLSFEDDYVPEFGPLATAPKD